MFLTQVSLALTTGRFRRATNRTVKQWLRKMAFQTASAWNKRRV